MSESGITAAKSSGRRGVAAKRAPDDIDRRLINALQGEFPLTETPFADIGAVLGLKVAAIGLGYAWTFVKGPILAANTAFPLNFLQPSTKEALKESD